MTIPSAAKLRRKEQKLRPTRAGNESFLLTEFPVPCWSETVRERQASLGGQGAA